MFRDVHEPQFICLRCREVSVHRVVTDWRSGLLAPTFASFHDGRHDPALVAYFPSSLVRHLEACLPVLINEEVITKLGVVFMGFPQCRDASLLQFFCFPDGSLNHR
jgi:hypothetical protein